jgi:hypothetical protein
VTNATKYTSSNIPSGKTYSFKVKPYKLVNGKRTFMDDSNVIEAATKPTKSVILSIKGGKGSINLVWNVISSDGYEIYVKNGSKWGLKATVTNYKTNTYTLKELSAGKQSVKIRAYKTDKNGKKVYNSYSDVRTATVTAAATTTTTTSTGYTYGTVTTERNVGTGWYTVQINRLENGSIYYKPSCLSLSGSEAGASEACQIAKNYYGYDFEGDSIKCYVYVGY